MSRIGRSPIAIPSGVEINIAGQEISVKGPKGTLSHVLAGPISIAKEDQTLLVTRPDDGRIARSLQERHHIETAILCGQIPRLLHKRNASNNSVKRVWDHLFPAAGTYSSQIMMFKILRNSPLVNKSKAMSFGLFRERQISPLGGFLS